MSRSTSRGAVALFFSWCLLSVCKGKKLGPEGNPVVVPADGEGEETILARLTKASGAIVGRSFSFLEARQRSHPVEPEGHGETDHSHGEKDEGHEAQKEELAPKLRWFWAGVEGSDCAYECLLQGLECTSSSETAISGVDLDYQLEEGHSLIKGEGSAFRCKTWNDLFDELFFPGQDTSGVCYLSRTQSSCFATDPSTRRLCACAEKGSEKKDEKGKEHGDSGGEEHKHEEKEEEHEEKTEKKDGEHKEEKDDAHDPHSHLEKIDSKEEKEKANKKEEPLPVPHLIHLLEKERKSKLSDDSSTGSHPAPSSHEEEKQKASEDQPKPEGDHGKFTFWSTFGQTCTNLCEALGGSCLEGELSKATTESEFAEANSWPVLRSPPVECETFRGLSSPAVPTFEHGQCTMSEGIGEGLESSACDAKFDFGKRLCACEGPFPKPHWFWALNSGSSCAYECLRVGKKCGKVSELAMQRPSRALSGFEGDLMHRAESGGEASSTTPMPNASGEITEEQAETVLSLAADFAKLNTEVASKFVIDDCSDFRRVEIQESSMTKKYESEGFGGTEGEDETAVEVEEEEMVEQEKEEREGFIGKVSPGMDPEGICWFGGGAEAHTCFATQPGLTRLCFCE
uniref:Uncharacterized protein n=1 Tax=Chromera velia CCMP2878 TaxID=1169474 RepID=A0A0G4GF14_9ALVE|eukprot:Cvel_21512.t1-p1 / transcript=Cvel_21512.t1 / gene=Cvel_21512 / organism=Chromera_velia_CCMP2878 / gene_product=hypothetical protein / transcript_product=hypothetical protein / location=Cvel_scaffold2025:673-3695(+) / protein_length=626 / sequence_SO=supercontig / SO=protein_coding / is_pseudo=false